jgi:transposase
MRKMSRPVRKVNSQVVGLDVHKREITYCILDRRGEEIAAGKFKAEHDALADFLRKYVGRRRSHVALEASGYSLWIYDQLAERYGTERVHLAQAKKIRAIANSRRKNDDNDAFWLAYLASEGRLPEAGVPTGVRRDLRHATRARIEAVRRATKLKVRIRSLLAQRGLRIRHTLDSKKGHQKLGEIVERADDIWGRRVRQAMEELDLQIARTAGWEETIDTLSKELPEIEELRREIPGLGRVLAAVVAAESGPIDRFESAKQYGGYTGLAPSDRSSGGRTVHGAISREGNATLRWALHEAIVACQKAKKGAARAVGDWVRRRTRRMGHVQKARCAAARKLAETIWRFINHGECFDPARAFAN